MSPAIMTYRVVREPGAENNQWGKPAVTSPEDAAALLIPELERQDAGREHVAVLFLDIKRRPIAMKTLFSGTIEMTMVSIGVIARDALLMGASAVVVAHNHPSGDTTPSETDKKTTRVLRKALAMVEIQLVDHIVVVGDKWRSTIRLKKTG